MIKLKLLLDQQQTRLFLVPKLFKTVSSITPSNNSSGAITVGTTGAGITTSGVTGSATLDGVAMIADISNKIFKKYFSNQRYLS